MPTVAERLPARSRSAAAAAARRVRAVPAPLGLLLLIAVVQVVAWSALTPPLQGPDEREHVAYAQHLAETGHAPKRNTGTGSDSTEVAKAGYDLNLLPMRGHLDGRPTWGALRRVSDQLRALPDAARKNGSGPNPIAQNPPLYYVYEAIAYRLSPNQSLFGRLFAMRLANGLLYVVTVALAWLLAAEIFTRSWPRFIATAAVALHPKLASLAGYINPDTLLVLLSTALLLAAVRLVKRGPTLRRVLIVGVLAGAAVLTHGRGFFVLVPAAAAVGIALVRARPPRREALPQLAVGGGALLLCVLLALVWTSSSSGGAAFGGEVGQATTQAFNVRQFLSYLWQFFFPRLDFMVPMLGPPYGYRQAFIETFFGGWGNFEVNFTRNTYDLLQVGAYLGLLALWTTVAVRWRAVLAQWPVVTVSVTAVVSLVGLLLVSSYRDLQQGGSPLITGRYLLPAIALYGIAIAWVAGSLPRRIGLVAAGLLTSAIVVLDVQGFLINLQRYFG